jgi:hypothetical protein
MQFSYFPSLKLKNIPHHPILRQPLPSVLLPGWKAKFNIRNKKSASTRNPEDIEQIKLQITEYQDA